MIESFQALFNGIALITCAMAIGASWVASIASPNCSFDKLTGARADSHVRELLYRTASPIAGLMLVSGALFLLATSWAVPRATQYESKAWVSALGNDFATRSPKASRAERSPQYKTASTGPDGAIRACQSVKVRPSRSVKGWAN